jgi:general secretion pathway protein D
MIQDRASKTSSQIPLLGDLPGLGPIFSDRNNTVNKTELIILITPRVVRDGAESRLVTEEYRRKMNVYMPHTSTRARMPINTLRRITAQ